jgi:hypothetical protein
MSATHQIAARADGAGSGPGGWLQRYGVLITVAVTLLLQGIAFVWHYGSLASRVANVESAVAPLRDGTLARLDERTQMILDAQRRMEAQLERRGAP